MRSHGRIALFAARIAVLGMLLAAPAVARAGADSIPEWLPEIAVESDEPDTLEEGRPLRGASARAALRRGRLLPASATLAGESPGVGAIRFGWIARSDGRGRAGAVLGARERAPGPSAVLGAFVVRDGGALFREALGTARAARTPPPVRADPAFFELPRGASSATVRGLGGVVGGARGAWALSGRLDSGAPIVAGGLWVRLGPGSWAIAGGRRGPGSSEEGARRVVSLAARQLGGGRTGGSGRSLGLELLLSPTGGPELLAEALADAEPLRFSARWRRRPGERRPVAARIATETSVRGARLRATWSPWSSRAPADDGRLEWEGVWRTRGLGPVRVRLGMRGGDWGEGGSPLGAGSVPRERYVVADLLLARERGRTFSLLLSRRETRAPEHRVAGSMIGGRLEVAARGRAGATLLVQAVRTSPDAGDAGDAGASARASAWSEGLTPSGGSALVERRRSGVSVSGKGWIRAGPLRGEVFVSDADAPAGATPAGGSIRLSWTMDDSR